jgi:hypothetical protein
LFKFSIKYTNLEDILLAVPVTLVFAPVPPPTGIMKLEIFIFSPPTVVLGTSLNNLFAGMVDEKPMPPMLALFAVVDVALIFAKLFALDKDKGPRVVLL